MNVAHVYGLVPADRGGLGLLIEAGAGPPRLVLRVTTGARAATCALDADAVAELGRIADDARATAASSGHGTGPAGTARLMVPQPGRVSG